MPKIDPAAIARHPRTRRWSVRLGIVFVVIGVLGFLVVPPVLKSVLLSKLGEALNRDVSIESISLNPYTLTATLSGVSIRERGEGKSGDGKAGNEVVGFDSLRVNAELASIAVAGVVIKEVELVGPRIRLVRLADNRYNISDLLDSKSESESESESKSPADEKKGGLPRFSVSNIRISGGKVVFDDRPEGVVHEVDAINLAIPFVSTLSYYADTYVEPHFSAKVNGAPLEMTGKTRPFVDSRESELSLDLDSLQLARYLAYSPVDLPIKVLSGALDTELKLRFLETKGQPSTISLTGTLALKDLRVDEASGAPLLAMKRLDVGLGDVDLVKRTIGIARVDVDTPQVEVRIDRKGILNWLALMPAAAPSKAPPAAAKDANPAFRILLANAALKGGVVNLLDHSTGVEQKGSIRDIDVTLTDFDSSNGKPFGFDLAWAVDAGERLQVKRVEIKDGRLDLARHEVVIGQYLLNGGRANLVRRKDGSLDSFRAPLLRVAEAAAKEKEVPWQVTVASASVSDQQLNFEDRVFSPPVRQTLEVASLQIDNFSTKANEEAKLAARMRVNKKGEIDLEGRLQPMLPKGELQLDLRGIELLPFQHYVSEFLNITVTRGQLAAKGTVSVAKAGEAVGAGYRGNVTLGNFHSVDKANAADFLKWKSFHLGNIDVSTQPLSVSVGEVALSDFYARVILSAEGKLNLLQIARKEEAPTNVPADAAAAPSATDAKTAETGKTDVAAAAAPASAKAVVPVKIGKVTLQGGNINFSDNFIKPNYSANLTSIGGRVTGLSSAEGSVADLELRGSYNDLAPITIIAKLNPFAAKSYLNLDAEVKGVEMTGFSSYSGKYAGYAIERGKLSLFLKYKIEDNKLVAENRVFLDQLAFGDEVDSPGATKLPVRLAVALLQNRKGEIDINLPISGSLDDPEFSVGGIIVQVIVNLIGKAITAPFALLGSLFGGGEEMSYVEFAYGYATLTEPVKERLRTLAKAIDDRPSIKLELAGRIDPELDREGLKKALMERRVKAQRLEELVKTDKEAGSVDDVEIPAKDYPKYLERAYKAEKFPKPRNMVGLVKELPVEEMEKLMMANMKADDEALRDLAVRRARAIGAWLTGEGKVPAERVFLLQPNMAPKDGPQHEKARDARVDFLLK